MSVFNAADFLSGEVTQALERRDPIPAGLYQAVIGEISPENIKSGTYEKGDNIGKPWASVAIPLKIQLPPEVQGQLGLQKPEFTLTHRIFVDLTPAGQLDVSKGRNNALRNLREATGMNKPGEAFRWGALSGQAIRVQINHELYEGNIQERVAQVLPL